MTLWEEIPTWGAREWERFLTGAALEPRTYCMCFAVAAAGVVLAGVPLPDDALMCVLTLYTLCVISLH